MPAHNRDADDEAYTGTRHTHSYLSSTSHAHVHNHDASYSATGHSHTHNHDGDYSATSHTHAHNHDGTYATAGHSHEGGSEAFPVGAVFISVVSTNPNSLLGYGTWASFAAGRVLVGLDANDTSFDTAEETGGAKTHTLTEAEMPAHTHNQQRHSATTGPLSGLVTAPDTSSNTPAALGPVTASTGGGGAHNNLQPYIVVYMWKRTA